MFGYVHVLLIKADCLCDEGGGGGGLVLKAGGQLAAEAVVSGQSMDAGLDENESKLAILVLLVSIEVLPDGDGLLDEHIQILGDLGGEASLLEQAQDLGTGHKLDLGDALVITEHSADLRGREALLGEFAHLVLDLGGRRLQPRRGGALVGQRATADALSGSMHASHLK